MSFQIKEIVLYSHSGAKRVLELVPGEVNIITGASKKGKSALIQIIEYCLGSDTCEVPVGPIRRTVSWFGLKLKATSGEIFVARRAPGPHEQATPDIYLDIASEVKAPEFASLRATANLTGLIDLMTRTAGIGANLHEPPAGQTRRPLAATIRHALWFTFQQQDEIISRKHLFHKQSEEWIPQALKDVLPFFLGAVGDDHVVKKERQRQLRERLRDYEKQYAELTAIRGKGLTKASSLFAEAQDLGLIETQATPSTWDEAVSELRSVVRQSMSLESQERADGSTFERLLEEREELTEQLRRVRQELGTVKAWQSDQNGFSREAGEQIARLKSISLFSETDGDGACPLCQGKGHDQVPTVAHVQSSLSRLEKRLDAVSQTSPQLSGVLVSLERKADELRRKLGENRAALEAIQKSNERLSEVRDYAARRAHVIGRVSLYLESVPAVQDSSGLQQEIERVKKQLQELDNELSDEQIQERLDSILSILAVNMSEWAHELELEHSEYPLRLDLRKLNVVADTPDGPVPMFRMGSGENWVGYHLIAHLALHKWFTERDRPVPRFLFIDQPSQIYFPAEVAKNTTIDSLPDDDRLLVARMFQLIMRVVKELAPNFQVIITEHADIQEDWFQNAVREKWRGGEALVPLDWIKPKDVRESEDEDAKDEQTEGLSEDSTDGDSQAGNKGAAGNSDETAMKDELGSKTDGETKDTPEAGDHTEAESKGDS